jgi:hypothetical protein
MSMRLGKDFATVKNTFSRLSLICQLWWVSNEGVVYLRKTTPIYSYLFKCSF